MGKKIIVLVPLILIIVVLGIVVMQIYTKKTNKAELKFNLPRIMQLQSSVFSNNQKIPAKYTCDDGDVNPPLSISDVPQNAKSLVLIVDDPDAPSGNWTHWLVWNIDPTTREITESSVPAGASEGVTDFGRPGYGGPCPPSGTHRYFFNLYALDMMLDLPGDTRRNELEVAITGHIIDQATLIGLYEKK